MLFLKNTIRLSLIVIFLGKGFFAQKNDTLSAQFKKEFRHEISDLEKQQISDSLLKLKIQQQLASLSSNDDDEKRKVLEGKLHKIQSNEAQRIALKKAKIDALRTKYKSFPVLGFFKDTLFPIYSKIGSFSAKDRAKAISERIFNLGKNFNFESDSLKTFESESNFDIIYGESIIMSITENDAIWNNTTTEDLSKKYREIIAISISNYKEESSISTLLKEIGLALLVLVILFFILKYTIRFFKWIAVKIVGLEGVKLNGVKVKNYTLLDSKRQVQLFLFLNNLLKWLFIILIIYFALPILFGIFPWTKGLASTLFELVLSPIKRIFNSFWNYLPNLITIIVIIIVFRYILKGVHFLKTEVEKEILKIPGFYPDWANPTYQIIKVLLYSFMFIVIFPYLPGSESPVFKGVSVFLGVLFTFGSSGSLSNVIAGLVLTYMRAFKIGDRIKIGDITGDVIEKSLLVTRIKTIKNEIISIPNSNVMSSHTTNYSSDALETGLILHTTVTIGYDVPWKQMHEVLIEAALKTEFVLKKPSPFVLQTSLDDFYVSYQLNAYTREPAKQALIYSNLHQNIQDCCNAAGIEILSPHYRAARDGNSTTIPSSYLDKNYKAPSFKVNIFKDTND